MRHTRYDGCAHPVRSAWIMAFAGAVVSLVPAAAALAGYVQLSQTRSLNTSASANLGGQTPTTDADSETSDALGSFVDRSVSSSASAAGPIPNPPFFVSSTGSGTARQSVQLAPTSISGSLVGSASAASTLAESSGTANSTWSTTFRVDQPTPFDLDGTLSVHNVAPIAAYTSATHDASLSLSRQADGGGAEQLLYNVSAPPFGGIDQFRPVDFSGVLEPGYVYRLAVTAAASRTNSSLPVSVRIGADTTTEATFALTAVPEPAAAGALALAAGLVLRRRRV
jgi:hypothetical protein